MTDSLPQILTASAYNFAKKNAVVYKNEKISYSELEEHSNQLANTLIKHGVQRGDRVGIYINKSIQSIISIFAIFKANAICVPLDPTAPISRISYIINDCEIKCLISEVSKKGKLTQLLLKEVPLTHAIFTCMDDISEDLNTIRTIAWDEVLSANSNSPLLHIIDIDLAYILYTSGSTGVPKGVMLSHRNVLSFINWASNFFKISHSDRVSSHAPLHFDLSIFDIFVTIKCGGSIHLVPSEINALPSDLAKFIINHKISVWQSVPSALVLLANQSKLIQWNFDCLRLVLFAGEVFPTKFLRKLMIKIPHAQYYNLYGSTEVNDVTCHQVDKVPSDSKYTIPIGKTCSHTEIFALDEHGKRITKANIIGELYVRGSNVSQGYWGNIEKVEKRFVQNPLQSKFHELVYRTGDLVELDLDDNYHYIGRFDSQVKVRGYRISLTEIEKIIFHYPGINEVCVIALQNEKQALFLKAFIVAKKDFNITYADVKQHCLKYLAKYMLPEEIEFCAFLPKTSTGKVDKQKLKVMKKQSK